MRYKLYRSTLLFAIHVLRYNDTLVLVLVRQFLCPQVELPSQLPVFCDISKAFDRVWHSDLICKLLAAGVTGEVLAWFKDYLKDIKHRVVLPSATSDWVYIPAGVLQGSILGPLLFLLYINDIVTDIGSNIRLFADDTSLFIIICR